MVRKHHHHQKRGGGSAWAYPALSDDDAASKLANGHPKCKPSPPQKYAQELSGSPGAGEAPGANGPPTTGAVGLGSS